MAYADLLKDPRWQKKRLEILQLDAFRCRVCESTTKTLHVHHLYYIKGNDPWDYPDNALITMCEGCHAEAPAIDWKRAFLDLNMTEKDLLELAINIKFRKFKIYENAPESKTRPLFPYMWYDLFNTMEEVDEYNSGFVQENRKEYING